MAIPAFFFGKAMGKKKGGGDTKTVTNTKTITNNYGEAPKPENAEEKRRKALQANTLFGTTTQSQEQGLL